MGLALNCVPGFSIYAVAQDSGDPFPFLKIFAFWGTVIALVGALIFGTIAVLTRGPKAGRVRRAGQIGVAAAIAWPVVIVGWLWADDAIRHAARDRERVHWIEKGAADAAANDQFELTREISSLCYDWAKGMRYGNPVPLPRHPRIVFVGGEMTEPVPRHAGIVFIRKDLREDDDFKQAAGSLLIAYTPLPEPGGYQLIFADGHVRACLPEGLRAIRLTDQSARAEIGLPAVDRYWPRADEK